MSRPMYPSIVFHFQRRPPLIVEVEIRADDPEAWELYALLKQARNLHCNIAAVMPLLEASHLILPDPAVVALKELLESLPYMARAEQESFMRHQDSYRIYRDTAYSTPASRALVKGLSK